VGTWPVLTTSDLDLTLDTWDFTQTLNDTLGDLGTPADGFDSYLNDTITLLSGLENLGGSLLDDLNLAAGIAGTIDPASLNSDAASLPATLATGDAIVADSNALLGSVTPPPQPPGGGGGGSNPVSGPPCGTHGDSAPLLSDNTQNCDAAYALPKVKLTEGPCTTEQRLDPGAYPPGPTVSAVSLKSGDAAMWVVAHDTVPDPSNAGMVIHRVLFTVTPRKVGHFLARFAVTTSRKPTPEVWCIIVDVIA
jgi:hypothetical protein